MFGGGTRPSEVRQDSSAVRANAATEGGAANGPQVVSTKITNRAKKQFRASDELLQIGIVTFFVVQKGRRTVSWNTRGFGRESQQMALDGLDNGAIVTSRQIRSAHRTCKQRVTAK